MKALGSAFSFLTVLRLPPKWTGGEAELSASVWFFPIVGVFVGGLVAGVAALFTELLPPWPLAVLLVITSAAISGGLHLDGLADTADGFFSSRPRGKILEIMHDSRIGTMGVLAIVFVVLLKITILAPLVGTARLWAAAFFMPLAGRCSLVLNMGLMPYAREEGLATRFWHRSPWRFLWALLFLLGGAWLAGEVRGILAAVAVLVLTGLFAMYCHHKIGGGTGDTLGAGNELAEVAAGLAFIAWTGGGGG